MAELQVLGISEENRWDNVVRSFDAYDVYYLSGYVKAFQLHGDGEPLLFYYEGQDIRGVNVVMKRDIAKDPHFAGKLPENEFFDFATPYGYGGWLLEGAGDPASVYAAYQNWCCEHHIISEFVRFELFSNSRASYYGDVIPRTNNIVRSLDIPLDEMRMDFEHKVRKNLKRAEGFGLEFLVDSEGKRLGEFLEIYYGTMARNDAAQSYYFKEEFFRQLNLLEGNYVYFHVLLEGKIIATELVIMGRDTMYSYLGGTNNEYFAYRPNDFLKYNIIKWGAENRYRRFVLGGGYGADDGIFRYKKSFAPNGVMQFYTGQAVFVPETYDMLVKKRVNLQDEAFFPKYRA